MTRLIPLAIIAGLLAVPGTPAEKQQNEVPKYRLRWQDLGRIITDRRVAVQLPAGTRLQGDVIKVEPDSLVLMITRTSDKHAYPKGRTALPRPEVTSLRVSKSNGYGWRVAGTVIGLGVAAIVVGSTAAVSHAEGQTAATSLLAYPALGTLGYFGGRSGDLKTFLIEIEPERKSALSEP